MLHPRADLGDTPVAPFLMRRQGFPRTTFALDVGAESLLPQTFLTFCAYVPFVGIE